MILIEDDRKLGPQSLKNFKRHSSQEFGEHNNVNIFVESSIKSSFNHSEIV
jgi:hypothetical protein